MSKKPEYKIPFSGNTGELLTCVWRDDDPNVMWLDPFEFEASLTYKRYGGGRSAMTMTVQSETGTHYPMFWCYFDQCIRRPNNGPGPTFHGKWTFAKRGNNYSVCPAVSKEETS